jgi:hypothetical protein
MRQVQRRRAQARTGTAEKTSSTIVQLTVLILGAIALLGFLLTT